MTKKITETERETKRAAEKAQRLRQQAAKTSSKAKCAPTAKAEKQIKRSRSSEADQVQREEATKAKKIAERLTASYHHCTRSCRLFKRRNNAQQRKSGELQIADCSNTTRGTRRTKRSTEHANLNIHEALHSPHGLTSMPRRHQSSHCHSQEASA